MKSHLKSLKSPSEIANEISEITPKSVISAVKSGEISEIIPKSVKSVKSMIPEPEYQTVQTGVDEINPIPDKSKAIDRDIQIIGNTAEKIGRISSRAVKQYKPIRDVEPGKPDNPSHALAISLVAIIATFAIAWFLFKDQIMEFVGKFTDDSGSLVMGFSPDGTRVYR